MRESDKEDEAGVIDGYAYYSSATFNFDMDGEVD
jgi:hypothetical protein